MTTVIAEITDVGQMVITTKGYIPKDKHSQSDLFHTWEWFEEKVLSLKHGEFIKDSEGNKVYSPMTKDDHIDWNRLIIAINTQFNNKTARAYVYGKFSEEWGEEGLR